MIIEIIKEEFENKESKKEISSLSSNEKLILIKNEQITVLQKEII